MNAVASREEAIRRPRILVVDDEVAMVRSLELLFRGVGDVVKAYSVPEAEEVLDTEIDCIVTDVSMPEASGLTLLQKIKSRKLDIPVVVMTAYSSVPEAVEAIQMGAFEYLTKPFTNESILATVKKALRRKGLSAGETESLPEGWVCNSQEMKDFLVKAERLVSSPAPILIVGQVGSGKRRAARWIVEKRKALKKFLSIEGPPREESHPLMDERMGAYSDLYIAEVFSLTRNLQDRLMELMTKNKLRVIAGSSAAPQIQNEGDFREDLRALLTRQVLKLPSLEDRKEDLEAVSLQLLESLKKTMRLSDLRLESDAIEAIHAHRFVENFRELEGVLQRAALESKTGVIRREDLRFRSEDLDGLLPFSIPVEEGWGRLEFLYRNLEKDLIQRALEKYPDASNTQIASILGTTRRILELRMKSYDIHEG